MYKEEIMTFEKLNKLVKKYHIPNDVHLQSDSGWECCETEMCGVYYSKKLNTIIFTQDISEYERYDERNKHHIGDFVALVDKDNSNE